MVEQVKYGELASFTLQGHRKDDGTVKVGHIPDKRCFEDWPDSMKVRENSFVYNLEFVVKKVNGERKKFYDKTDVPKNNGREEAVYM